MGGKGGETAGRFMCEPRCDECGQDILKRRRAV